MTTEMTDLEIIKGIQAKLMLAMEQKDKALQKKYADELHEARGKVARKMEMEALSEELANRDVQRRRAERITEKANAQRLAIDSLLEARDAILPLLNEAVAKARELPALQLKASEYFSTAQQLGGSNPNRRIPHGYLPAKLKASTLEMRGGTRSAQGATNEALYFLRSAQGLLTALERLDSDIPQREATLFEDVEDVLTSKKKKS